MLCLLIRRPGELVTRDELFDKIWPGRIVSESTLASCIRSLRKALGDTGREQNMIATVHKRGVIFKPQVTAIPEDEPFEVYPSDDSETIAVETPIRTRDRRPVVAILPFADLAPANDPFVDGVVEEITSALSRVRDFDVIARQSVYALRAAATDRSEIAIRLGADYLVEGSVQRLGERVRVSANLLTAGDGCLVWSELIDDHLDDLFNLQDRLSQRLAGAISPNIRHAEIKRASGRPPKDRNAYERVLTAYPYFWSHREEDNRKAIELFSAALEEDPDYALAAALKSWAVAQQCAYGWSNEPQTDRQLALDLADHALSRSTDHAPTLVACGAAITLASTQQSRARALILRALSIDPNNAWGWMRLGWNAIHIGEYEKALDCFDHASHLSPLDPFRFNFLFGRAVACEHLDRIEEAIEAAEEAIHSGPGGQWGYRLLVRFHAKNGAKAAARQALMQLLSFYPNLTVKGLMAQVPPSISQHANDYFADLIDAGLPRE